MCVATFFWGGSTNFSSDIKSGSWTPHNLELLTSGYIMREKQMYSRSTQERKGLRQCSSLPQASSLDFQGTRFLGLGSFNSLVLLSVHILPNGVPQPSLDLCLWKTNNETLNSWRGLVACQSSWPGRGCCVATSWGSWVPRKFNRWWQGKSWWQ